MSNENKILKSFYIDYPPYQDETIIAESTGTLPEDSKVYIGVEDIAYVDGLEEALNAKVDKTTITSQLYATDSSGSQSSLTYSIEPSINTVVQRSETGTIKTQLVLSDSKKEREYQQGANATVVDNIQVPPLGFVRTNYLTKINPIGIINPEKKCVYTVDENGYESFKYYYCKKEGEDTDDKFKNTIPIRDGEGVLYGKNLTSSAPDQLINEASLQAYAVKMLNKSPIDDSDNFVYGKMFGIETGIPYSSVPTALNLVQYTANGYVYFNTDIGTAPNGKTGINYHYFNKNATERINILNDIAKYKAKGKFVRLKIAKFTEVDYKEVSLGASYIIQTNTEIKENSTLRILKNEELNEIIIYGGGDSHIWSIPFSVLGVSLQEIEFGDWWHSVCDGCLAGCSGLLNATMPLNYTDVFWKKMITNNTNEASAITRWKFTDKEENYTGLIGKNFTKRNGIPDQLGGSNLQAACRVSGKEYLGISATISSTMEATYIIYFAIPKWIDRKYSFDFSNNTLEQTSTEEQKEEFFTNTENFKNIITYRVQDKQITIENISSPSNDFNYQSFYRERAEYFQIALVIDFSNPFQDFSIKITEKNNNNTIETGNSYLYIFGIDIMPSQTSLSYLFNNFSPSRNYHYVDYYYFNLIQNQLDINKYSNTNAIFNIKMYPDLENHRYQIKENSFMGLKCSQLNLISTNNNIENIYLENGAFAFTSFLKPLVINKCSGMSYCFLGADIPKVSLYYKKNNCRSNNEPFYESKIKEIEEHWDLDFTADDSPLKEAADSAPLTIHWETDCCDNLQKYSLHIDSLKQTSTPKKFYFGFTGTYDYNMCNNYSFFFPRQDTSSIQLAGWSSISDTILEKIKNKDIHFYLNKKFSDFILHSRTNINDKDYFCDGHRHITFHLLDQKIVGGTEFPKST